MNFFSIDPINALIYSAFLNGLVAPVILALIVIISSKKAIMGKWTNRRSITAIGWFVTLMMSVVGIAGIYSIFYM